MLLAPQLVTRTAGRALFLERQRQQAATMIEQEKALTDIGHEHLICDLNSTGVVLVLSEPSFSRSLPLIQSVDPKGRSPSPAKRSM